jgi:hypothetical protein
LDIRRLPFLPRNRLDRRGNPAYPFPYLIYGKSIYGKWSEENGVTAGTLEIFIRKTLILRVVQPA